jgi:hypothetical protein
MVLLLNRTMLTGALAGLRGPLCLRLASACNHRPEDSTAPIICLFQKNSKQKFRHEQRKIQKLDKNFPTMPLGGAGRRYGGFAGDEQGRKKQQKRELPDK